MSERFWRMLGFDLERGRQALWYTQREVADAMRRRGFDWTETTVANVEHGRRKLSVPEYLWLQEIVPLMSLWRPNTAVLRSAKPGPALPVEDFTERDRLVDERLGGRDVSPRTRQAFRAAATRKVRAAEEGA